jgi:hypothetical protein
MQPGVKANQDVRGLALLVRKGMATWMRGLSQPCKRPTAAPTQRDGTCAGSAFAAALPERPALGIEHMLVNILAAMTYANSMETCT